MSVGNCTAVTFYTASQKKQYMYVMRLSVTWRAMWSNNRLNFDSRLSSNSSSTYITALPQVVTKIIRFHPDGVPSVSTAFGGPTDTLASGLDFQRGVSYYCCIVTIAPKCTVLSYGHGTDR